MSLSSPKQAPLTAALAHLSKPWRPVSSWCCQDIIHKQGEEGSVESRKMRLGQLNGRMRWQLEESSLEDPTGVFRAMERDIRSCGPWGMQIYAA